MEFAYSPFACVVFIRFLPQSTDMHIYSFETPVVPLCECVMTRPGVYSCLTPDPDQEDGWDCLTQGTKMLVTDYWTLLLCLILMLVSEVWWSLLIIFLTGPEGRWCGGGRGCVPCASDQQKEPSQSRESFWLGDSLPRWYSRGKQINLVIS